MTQYRNAAPTLVQWVQLIGEVSFEPHIDTAGEPDDWPEVLTNLMEYQTLDRYGVADYFDALTHRFFPHYNAPEMDEIRGFVREYKARGGIGREMLCREVAEYMETGRAWPLDDWAPDTRVYDRVREYFGRCRIGGEGPTLGAAIAAEEAEEVDLEELISFADAEIKRLAGTSA